jgi:hypothetical protein
MELSPQDGWEGFQGSKVILDLLWWDFAPEHWHSYSPTAGTHCWECRYEPANRVLVELSSAAIRRLVIEQNEEDYADSAWTRGLGGLAGLLVRDFGMAVRPTVHPCIPAFQAPDRSSFALLAAASATREGDANQRLQQTRH